MKKVLFTALAAASFAFASCGAKQSADTQHSTTNDAAQGGGNMDQAQGTTSGTADDMGSQPAGVGHSGGSTVSGSTTAIGNSTAASTAGGAYTTDGNSTNGVPISTTGTTREHMPVGGSGGNGNTSGNTTSKGSTTTAGGTSTGGVTAGGASTGGTTAGSMSSPTTH
jgi:hypothetical protein